MKRFQQKLCLIMCLVLVFVCLPRPVSALRYYEGIDLSQIERYRVDKFVSLTIGDLTFNGGRMSQGVSDEVLARFAGESLKELGLTADEVILGQNWMRYRDVKMEEFRKILESYELENQLPNFLIGLAGLLPGPTGTIAGVGGTIYAGATAEGASGIANTGLSAAGTAAGIVEQLPIIGGITWLLQYIVTGMEQ